MDGYLSGQASVCPRGATQRYGRHLRQGETKVVLAIALGSLDFDQEERHGRKLLACGFVSAKDGACLERATGNLRITGLLSSLPEVRKTDGGGRVKRRWSDF